MSETPKRHLDPRVERAQNYLETYRGLNNIVCEMARDVIGIYEQFEALQVDHAKLQQAVAKAGVAKQVRRELLRQHDQASSPASLPNKQDLLLNSQEPSSSSGERVAAGEPSSTSTQGANQSPETSFPASEPEPA